MVKQELFSTERIEVILAENTREQCRIDIIRMLRRLRSSAWKYWLVKEYYTRVDDSLKRIFHGSVSFIFHSCYYCHLAGELKFHGIVIRDNRDNPWILQNFVRNISRYIAKYFFH